MKKYFFALSLFVLTERAFAIEVICKISDASKQRANEAPSVLGTVTQTKPSPIHKDRKVTNTTNLITQTPPERCQQKMACISVKNRPMQYVLCDATYSIKAEVYVGNVSVHVEEAATRQALATATAPEEGFSSLTLRTLSPDVFVQCDLQTEQNRDCK